MNCRGLGDRKKRRDVFNFLRETKASVICIQDIRIDPKLETYIRAEWGYDIIFSPYKSNARGTAILLNPNYEYKIKKYKKGANGDYIIVELTVDNKPMVILSIYGPNRDSPQFYERLCRELEEFNTDQYILCGDWNATMDPEMDTFNY